MQQQTGFGMAILIENNLGEGCNSKINILRILELRKKYYRQI